MTKINTINKEPLTKVLWDHESAADEADKRLWKAIWYSYFGGGCIVIGDQDDLPPIPGGWQEISRRELEKAAMREPRRADG
jgi:hypothetical protein